MTVLVTTVGLFLAALFAGRSWLFVLPATGWPLYFLGLHRGWWGHGIGDLWQYALIGVTLVGLLAVAVGLALRGFLAHGGF